MEITHKSLKEQFESEYDLFNFKDHYTDWSGEVCLGVHTNETEEEIRAKYEEILFEYEPFVVVNDQVYELVYKNAEREFEREKKMKQRHNDEYGYQEGEFEKYNEVVSPNDLESQIIEESEISKIVDEMKRLSGKQASRIYKYLIEEMTIEEIAADEQACISAVWESIIAAKKKLQIRLKNF